MKTAITRNIEVTAHPKYISKESDPKNNVHVFAYDILIKNQGFETVQIVFRFWSIKDGDGKLKHVQGPGVVGVQPIIRPNENFKYSSYCNLNNSSGYMEGKYECRTNAGEHFFIQIPKFELRYPVQLAYSKEL